MSELTETLKKMEADKEARRGEYAEVNDLALGHCDGYRDGVKDSRLLIEAEGEGEAMALLRRWVSAFEGYMLLANSDSLKVGELVNDTRRLLRGPDATPGA